MQAWTEVTQAEMKAIKARMATMQEKMGASHIEMVSAFKPKIEEETMACQETTEAHLEEEKPASVDTKPEAHNKKRSP
jgi:hypothetical protein